MPKRQQKQDGYHLFEKTANIFLDLHRNHTRVTFTVSFKKCCQISSLFEMFNLLKPQLQERLQLQEKFSEKKNKLTVSCLCGPGKLI